MDYFLVLLVCYILKQLSNARLNLQQSDSIITVLKCIRLFSKFKLLWWQMIRLCVCIVLNLIHNQRWLSIFHIIKWNKGFSFFIFSPFLVSMLSGNIMWQSIYLCFPTKTIHFFWYIISALIKADKRWIEWLWRLLYLLDWTAYIFFNLILSYLWLLYHLYLLSYHLPENL